MVTGFFYLEVRFVKSFSFFELFLSMNIDVKLDSVVL